MRNRALPPVTLTVYAAPRARRTDSAAAAVSAEQERQRATHGDLP
jgi:hypothetical protein